MKLNRSELDPLMVLIKLQEIAKIGVWQFHIASGQVIVSRTIEALPGVEPFKSTSLEHLLKNIKGGLSSSLSEFARNCLATGSARRQVSFQNTKNEWVNVELHGFVVKDETQAPEFIFGTYQDVSETVRVKKNVEVELRKFSALYDQSSDAIMIMGESGGFDSCNAATLKLFEIGSEAEFCKLIPADISPLFQPDGRLSSESSQEKIKTAFKKGHNFFEWTHKTNTGSIKHCNVLLSRIEGPMGTPYLQATVRDISSEKENQRKLEQLTNELNFFFESKIGLLAILNEKGRLLRVNPLFSEMLGYSANELNSKTLLELVDPEEVEKLELILSQLIPQKQVTNFETTMKTSQGVSRVVNWNAKMDEKTRRIFASARDVTEEKSKTWQLQQLMNAIDHSAIVSATDCNGVITEVNQLFVDVSGYSADELMGRTHKLVNSGVHSKSFFADLWKTLKKGMVWTGIIQNRTKTGQPYFVKTVITPIKDLKGNIQKFLSIRFDLTDQVISERKLDEAQRVADIGSWSFDLATQQIDWSKQMFTLFDEKIENGPPNYERHKTTIHEEDRDLWEGAVRECAAHGTPYKIRFRSMFPDKFYWVEAIGQANRDREGHIIGMKGTCQNITEVVWAEEQLKVERAKSIHAAKLASLGEMSAGIAHEINNPLAIISGNTVLLKRVLEEHKEGPKLDAISKAVDRIQRIVDGLRKFSRSSVHMVRKEESLNAIISESIFLSESKAKRHNVEVRRKTPIDFKIKCDLVEMEQVLVNLINNSIDAVKNRSNRWVCIETEDLNDKIKLRVIDSGEGISESLENKLFQPFFTTKAVGEGTGLGLSITKGIIESHFGILTLNRDFKNTCFEIVLPAVKEGPYES